MATSRRAEKVDRYAMKVVVVVFIGLWLAIIGSALAQAEDAHQERMASTERVWICEEGWRFKEVENSPGLFIPKPPTLHRCVSPNGRQEVQADFVRLTHEEIAEIPQSQRSNQG